VTPRLRAELVLLGVTLAWGGSFLVVKDTLGTLEPFRLIALRFALAVAALATLFGRRALALGRDAGGRPQWRAGLGIGLLLWAGFAFQTLGLRDTTPARSAFITTTYVAMVPLLMRVISGRPLRKRVVGAAAAALIGLYLLTDPDSGGANPGDWLTLLGALAFAGHMVALDRGARAMPAPGLAFAQMAVVAGASLPFALAEGGASEAFSGRSLAALGYLGLICSAAGFLGQTWGQRHTSPVRVGLIFSLESLFAALLSVALGMETLTPLQWAGGLLLVAGVVVGELPEEPAPRAA
jgi:drug/metabolite transporter (DMT)-like permease